MDDAAGVVVAAVVVVVDVVDVVDVVVGSLASGAAGAVVSGVVSGVGLGSCGAGLCLPPPLGWRTVTSPPPEPLGAAFPRLPVAGLPAGVVEPWPPATPWAGVLPTEAAPDACLAGAATATPESTAWSFEGSASGPSERSGQPGCEKRTTRPRPATTTIPSIAKVVLRIRSGSRVPAQLGSFADHFRSLEFTVLAIGGRRWHP